jgi:CubicO group peptidase (beta-lactamase class C family)
MNASTTGRPEKAQRRVVMLAALVIGVLSSTMLVTTPASAHPVGHMVPVQTRHGSQVGLRTLLGQVVAAGIPGAVARVQDGAAAQVATAGVSDLATGAPLGVQARFRVGSITKTFVATAVLQLVGAGRLGLDQPVARWLPGLLVDGDIITVRQLLNHTSGLFDYTNDPALLAGVIRNRVFQPQELVAMAQAHPRVGGDTRRRMCSARGRGADARVSLGGPRLYSPGRWAACGTAAAVRRGLAGPRGSEAGARGSGVAAERPSVFVRAATGRNLRRNHGLSPTSR